MERYWRLILDIGHDAAFNMAADEAIFTTHAAGKVPPTLRIYDWKTPALSLGYFQDVERARLDVDYCRRMGVSLVRRPTGGRTVLHGHDITFSISVEEREIPDDCRSIVGSHVWLMRGIAAGLELLGIHAEIGPGNCNTLGQKDSADCFAHMAQCDVRLGNEKAAGAAQLRKWGALLEQGSIPCRPPAVDPGRIFGTLKPRAGFGIIPSVHRIPRHTIKMAIVRGFEKSLQISFRRETLSNPELELALELETARYGSAEWTYRRGTERVDKSMLDCYTDNAILRGGRYHAQENPRR